MAPTAERRAGPIRVEHSDGVAILTLDDAAHRNVLSHEMSRALEMAVDEALAAGARCLLLSAVKPVFCAGGSLDDLAAPTVPLRAMYDGFRRLAGAPVPTIAAVNGPCIGAGLNLPLACDVIITSPAAIFDPRFLDVGIHPGGGHLWRLGQRVGFQGAAALVLFGDRLDGQQAAAVGLAWRCVPEDDLQEVALGMARRAAERDLDLVVRTKESWRASAMITKEEAAVDLELAAQEWSVARPEFRPHIVALREEMHRRRNSKVGNEK
jgi:enoyl-CoA hydratase